MRLMLSFQRSALLGCLTCLCSFAALGGEDILSTNVTSSIPVESNSPSVSTAWYAQPYGVDPAMVIDLALEASWRTHQLQPTAPADERVFLRRIYLDLIGRIPRPQETQSFLADTDVNKRILRIDALLQSEAHAVHLSEVLDAILIGRTDTEQLRRRTAAGWIDYLKRAIDQNRPWNEVARDALLARPSSPIDQGANWYLYARRDKPQEIAEAVSKDFFGVRIDCAQCHDHPLASEIKQQHYWGLVAFFNRSKNVDTPEGPAVSESAIGGFSEFSNLEGDSTPNELVFLGDRRVEETRPASGAKEEDRDELYVSSPGSTARVPKFSRREQFVERVLDGHPLLAKAMVNRLWAWMMGRGIVHPVDAIDSYHAPSHPELLDWLAGDFAASGYDVRRLLRSLARTRAYQLSSKEDAFVDPQWFSAAIVKPLTAEMLQRSMLVAFDPIEPSQWNSLEQRVMFSNAFPDVIAEESISNVTQGLLLTNGDSVNDLVSIKHSHFLQTLRDSKSSDASLIRLLFEALLNRPPDAEELVRCESFISSRPERRDQAIESAAWAIVSSAEFRFNH